MKSRVVTANGRTEVKLSGDLDDRCMAPLLELASRIPAGPARFDLSELGYVNSMGCGHWLAFLRTMGTRIQYEFVGCQEPFVSYANLLSGFVGTGRIASFHAPFRCTACDAEPSILLTAEDPGAPQCCSKCGARLEAVLVMDEYCAFLDAAG